MQTVASLAERLDMSAEEAVEKLRYLFYDVEGVESSINDEQIDLLIDIDDDPALAEELREERLKEQEKEKKLAEKRKAAAKKAAAKKKEKAKAKKKPATKKKAAAKKKAPTKKKTAAKTKTKTKAKAKPKKKEAAPETEVKKPAAEILPETPEEEVARPKAEILPPETAAEEAAKEEKEEAGITVGSAIDHERHRAEVIRADGTHVDVTEVELGEEEAAKEAESEEEEESEIGLLARAEREEEEEKRRRKQKSTVEPDPKVVAEVIRRAHESKAKGAKKGKGRKTGQEEPEVVLPQGRKAKQPQTVAPSGPRKTGKTARKRQKKIERMRREEELRRSAAAAVKEYQSGAMGAGAKKRKKKRAETEGAEFEGEQAAVIQVDEGMTVEALAEAMEIDPTDIILELMELDIMATKNQSLGIDVVRKIAEPKGFEVEAVIPEEEELVAEEPDKPEDLVPRAPVITVMGHVDHGKTSLLDQVRKASVAAGEAGGITQHIAAYEVNLPQGKVVFLDTPGHEAFTAMRARGAQVTDVVVLVVAADDGIMPQTREAIDHAKAAEVPIVVAINKCDKPDAQPERIRQELTEFGLVDEAWGGKTIMRNISALTGEGIEELMEMLVLETELLELKANPNKRARGAIVEAEVTRGQGPVAWVLVKSGTLRVGDSFLAGETYGRVRAMLNSAGDHVEEAGPSTPVVVLGFNAPPHAGDQFLAVADERAARSIADQREHRSKMKGGPAIQHVTLEDFHRSLKAGEQSELHVVLKADVQGSVDVLESSLPDIGNEEASVKIVHAGVGAINESDVLLASASDAVVMGFHVEPTPKAEHLAQTEGVEIKTYKVIYELTEDLRKSLEGLLEPEKREVVTGHAEIRKVFKSSSLGSIAGCMLTDGEITRDAFARLRRDDEVVWEGRIGSLRREKDQVTSVQSGYECGIKLANFDDIQEGDIIEAYRVEEVAKSLS